MSSSKDPNALPRINQGCMEASEDIPSSSSSERGQGTVPYASNFYTGKPPLKFDFHLPDELWQMILEMLTEDEDRTNCCRALPLFDKLLTKSKPVWMFKQILPFVGEAIFETKTDVLLCRRICKQWCDDTDHHVSNYHRKPGETFFSFENDLFSFKSLEDVDRFSNTFEAHFHSGRNPFVNKTVWFQYNREDGFQNKLLDLLSKFKMKGVVIMYKYGNGAQEDESRFFDLIKEKLRQLRE